MNHAVIGVGSNIEPEHNITAAREQVTKQFHLLRESQFVETEPVGFKAQPNFLNGAFLIETTLPLPETQKRLRTIEECLGRLRTSDKNAPRSIDLDIVIWNSQVLDPDIYDRDFLKEAVLEVSPELNL